MSNGCKWYLSDSQSVGAGLTKYRMHVFTDLQPYICTFQDCKYELAQFATRAAWADHEFTTHRINRYWTCPECPAEYTKTSDWKQHLQSNHQRSFDGDKLQIAQDMACQMRARVAENEECPLCRVVVGKPRRAFVRHVARHMEEIALITLPRDTEEDSDCSSVSTRQESSRQSDPSHSAQIPESIIGTNVLDPRKISTMISAANYESSMISPHFGRILAPDHPGLSRPSPPPFLSLALSKLQATYPDDLFEGIMRYTAVSTLTDRPISVRPNEPPPPDTKFMYYPRIKCLDCPGKLYTPGPGTGVTNFEVHLKNRLHRERVEERVTSGVGELAEAQQTRHPNNSSAQSVYEGTDDTATAKREHRCSKCGAEFLYFGGLERHKRETPVRPWKCYEPSCERSGSGFHTDSDCEEHIRRVHGKAYVRSMNTSEPALMWSF